MLKLYIGNKNYSSWSMRPWVLMKAAGIGFEEVKVRFDSFEADSSFKRTMGDLVPTGKVPALAIDEQPGRPPQVVWDTLAIAETLAERFPDLALWPTDARRRALARSLCAEMHSGFTALRSHCPMNIEAHLPEVGARLMAEQPGVRADLARIEAMWTGCLDAHGGPWLMGDRLGIVDAYYAPVAMRLRTYALPVHAAVASYVERLSASPGVAAWIADALAEHDFLDFEEPYRRSRT
ncbi:glutathione S-transferase family protein [Leptothrix discophora]|uniref:Glutathione S-transferase family protein n=1 Tax=Leptothrix discophora TaxID=89 RepID=A0ABT9G7H1_LEPDI|nr:glutathione S-transferase family protein [Leptothrix discophora]MDP4302420.1 glutathione S-transferase family protein [Leptothrix discophora]